MNKASDQTPNIPQHLEHGVLPHMQRINQRMPQTFSRSTRLSEENNALNMPRNNDDGDPNNPSNSVRETNISSFNVQGNTIKNSFNKKSYVGPDPSELESVCVVFRFWCIAAKVDLSFRERGNQLCMINNARGGRNDTIGSTNFVFLGSS